MNNHHVVYYWYDHLLLRKNGDAEKVQQAIKNHDYDAFMELYNKYEGYEVLFFPKIAYIYEKDSDEIIGEVLITNRNGFSLINDSEYECG